MKCDFCGADIPDGSVYCLKCGKGVQVVPDFDELEEELLPAMVGKDPKPPQEKKKKNKKNKDKNKKIKVAALSFAAVVLVVACVYSYFNSYGYLLKKGKEADKKEKYAIAADYYELALSHRDTVEAHLALGIDYTNSKEYEAAENSLLEALELDKKEGSNNSEDIYRALLILYDTEGNYDAIEEIMEANKDSGMESLFEEYYINPPEFSELGGDFEDDVELTLSSEDGYEIYYTTDKTMPSSHNGLLYSEPIKLEKGETTVNACCVNDSGKWGRIVSETYNVTYKIPPKPSASPAGGTFHEPMFVELSTRHKDGQIYYTWDGSEPTKDSALYEGPIQIPEGNTVLSAIVIDEHDMASKILKCNYLYLP